jgi:hypothetical protein
LVGRHGAASREKGAGWPADARKRAGTTEPSRPMTGRDRRYPGAFNRVLMYKWTYISYLNALITGFGGLGTNYEPAG